MELNFRMGVSDVNSDYINAQVAQFKRSRPAGISIIQLVEAVTPQVTALIEHIEDMDHVELIIVAASEAAAEDIQRQGHMSTMAGSIEQAKLYVK